MGVLTSNLALNRNCLHPQEVDRGCTADESATTTHRRLILAALCSCLSGIGITAAVTVVLASWPCSAHAQAQQLPVPQEGNVLPEVSVSATRVERDNMDIPVSIDTIDQRTIREGNPQVNLSESLSLSLIHI